MENETSRFVTIQIGTQEHIVTGKLELPVPSVIKNNPDPSEEDLLFYVLNSGNLFLTVRDCTIMDRFSAEYQPEHVKRYNINLNIVHSCRIIDDIK